MLERIRVQGFKSLRDATVELAPLVVLFGPNAAGKSNLLEALLLLSRLVGERTLSEAFAEGIRGYPLEAFTLAEGGLEQLLHGPSPCLRLEAEMSMEPPPGRRRQGILSYQVEVAIDPQSGRLSVQDERLEDLTPNRKPRHRNPCLEKVPRDRDGSITDVLAIRRHGSPSHPFEEGVGLSHTIVSNRQFTGAERYPLFDQLHQEIGSWRILYLDPIKSMRDPQPPRDVNDIGSRGEWLVPYLHRLKHQQPQAFAAVRRVIAMAIPAITDLQTDLNEKRGELELSVQMDGLWLPSRVVSEGTLRLLALCAMAANPFQKGLVAFEEPENGVHPRRIEVVTRLLARASRSQQVIVTTHSPQVVVDIVRMIREGELKAGHVRLIRCATSADGSTYQPFDPMGPLFDEEAIMEGLGSSEEAQVLQAMTIGGWLDG
ncbi:AAA family ATPase [Cyanobium sp. FGCU-6]|nr:AAA family ATPase [Cyanobium sp. FGCU6]